MSAVLKPSTDRRNRPRKAAAVPAQPQFTAPVPSPTPLRPHRDLRVVPAQPVSQPTIRRLPVRETLPRWLRSLVKLQQASLIATFTLSGVVLATYGWTVYAQQLWSKEYQKLEELRRNERQLSANGEVLKNQIANQANRPNTTLVPRTPDNMIFLQPAPTRDAAPANAPAPQASPIAPLGY